MKQWNNDEKQWKEKQWFNETMKQWWSRRFIFHKPKILCLFTFEKLQKLRFLEKKFALKILVCLEYINYGKQYFSGTKIKYLLEALQ